MATEDSSWKGTSPWGAGEALTREQGQRGQVGMATGTIGAVSEGADVDGTDAAAVGRADCAASWDGNRRGGTGSTLHFLLA